MNQTDYAQQIQALAKRLDRLLEATLRLAAENQVLKQQYEQLAGERTQLQGKNELARHRARYLARRR